jgi:hypothetical protein
VTQRVVWRARFSAAPPLRLTEVLGALGLGSLFALLPAA